MYIHIYDDFIKSDNLDVKVDKLSITINKTIDDFVIIKSNNNIINTLTINIFNSSIKLIDEGLNSNLVINLNKNSKLIYQSIFYNPSNLNKQINIYNNANFEYELISLNSYIENTTISLLEEYANCNVGYLIINDNANSSIFAKVNHLAKNTTSTISNYGVCNNFSNINFDIVGLIEKNNSNSDAKQLTKGVIIGDNSTIKAIPSLLINEYDVKAYHGASIGKMSDDDLFYLMSRGLSKSDAFRLILTGVINPFINVIEVKEFKDRLITNIEKII